MKKLFILTVILSFNSTMVQARPPPASPNFCAYGLCLEIAQLSGKGVSVKTSSDNSKSEVVIVSAAGTTEIVYPLASRDSCKSQGSMDLQKMGHSYVGHGCVSVLGQDAKWRDVSLKFTPPVGVTPEAAMLGMPVLAIWPVDSSPFTFWEGGYALRVGNSIKIEWQSLPKR